MIKMIFTFPYKINEKIMSLFQVEISDDLKKAIKKKAGLYGITASAMVRIVLVQSFIEEGNVFNADRDNNGKGVSVDEIIEKL